MIQLFLFLFLFSGSDIQSENAPDLQSELIRQFFVPRNGNHLPRYVRGNNPDIEDVCSWSAIQCIDSNVISIYICATTADFGTRMEWMPPTVRHVHFFGAILLHGWSTENLSRELLYLYLYGCHLNGSAEVGHAVDLRRLPSQMEELILINGWYNGLIRLDALPRALSFLFISSAVASNFPIEVNYALFPANLERVYITSSVASRGVSIRVSGSTKTTKCVVTQYDMKSLRMDSKYFQMFQQKIQLSG